MIFPGLGLALDPVWLWLLLGVVLAVPYLRVGQRLRGRRGRVWWAGGLVIAALLYVAFALAAGASGGALAVEVGGVLLYGVPAALGLRGHRGWLAAGWLLHPLWDLGLHGAGGVAPEWYVWACLSFDLVVGASLWRGVSRSAG